MSWFKRFVNKVKKIGKTIKEKTRKVGKFIHDTISNKETIERTDITKDEALALLISRQAYRVPKLQNIDDYMLLTDLSNETTVVYRNNQNELWIGYRGSKVLNDWTGGNLDILKHDEANNERFKQDLEYFDFIVGKLQPSKIIIAGHSLAGMIVMFINSQRNNINKCYAINPAFNLNSFNKYFKFNVTILRTLNDAVSSPASFSRFKVRTIKSNFDDETTFMNVIKSHGLGAFLD